MGRSEGWGVCEGPAPHLKKRDVFSLQLFASGVLATVETGRVFGISEPGETDGTPAIIGAPCSGVPILLHSPVRNGGCTRVVLITGGGGSGQDPVRSPVFPSSFCYRLFTPALLRGYPARGDRALSPLPIASYESFQSCITGIPIRSSRAHAPSHRSFSHSSTPSGGPSYDPRWTRPAPGDTPGSPGSASIRASIAPVLPRKCPAPSLCGPRSIVATPTCRLYTP